MYCISVSHSVQIPEERRKLLRAREDGVLHIQTFWCESGLVGGWEYKLSGNGPHKGITQHNAKKAGVQAQAACPSLFSFCFCLFSLHSILRTQSSRLLNIQLFIVLLNITAPTGRVLLPLTYLRLQFLRWGLNRVRAHWTGWCLCHIFGNDEDDDLSEKKRKYIEQQSWNRSFTFSAVEVFLTRMNRGPYDWPISDFFFCCQ